MVTELTRAVNFFTGNFDQPQPIKLELLATGPVVDVDSLTVIGIMRNRWLIL